MILQYYVKMNERGLSALSYLLVGLFIVGVIMIFPLPHYNTESGWYKGPSFAVRMLGSYEEGAPIDQVYKVVAEAAVSSPFEIRCATDSDCASYTVVNQCKKYCGNLDGANADTARKLENNRVCDPARWSRPAINCSCVLGRCINLSQ